MGRDRSINPKRLRVAVSHPSSPSKHAPVRVGELAGIALADEDDQGITPVTTQGSWTVSVKGVNGGGNTAVAIGDKIYYVDGDTPNCSKKTSGTFLGYAMGAVDSGATATISVALPG
jgi:hypothetical protein